MFDVFLNNFILLLFFCYCYFNEYLIIKNLYNNSINIDTVILVFWTTLKLK